MISHDVKKQKIKELVAVSCIFFNKKYLENLEHNVPSGMYFHLTLHGIPLSLVLSVKDRG